MEKTTDSEESLDLFWMTFAEALPRSAFRARHLSLSSAVEEARRLAVNHPKKKVYVLEAIGFAKTQEAPILFQFYDKDLKSLVNITEEEAIKGPRGPDFGMI